MRRDELASRVTNHFDIVDVISRYLNVIKRGQNFFAVCPFHDDTRPSLVISKSKKIFKCFVCGEAGNVISFVSKYKKISFQQATLELANEMGIDTSESQYLVKKNEELEKFKRFCEANNQAQDIFVNYLYASEHKQILESLYKRGLNDELIKEFGLGYAPKNNMLLKIMNNKDNFFGPNRAENLIWPLPELFEYSLVNILENGEYADFFSGRITFPIKDTAGNIIGFSGRDTVKNSNIKYLNSKSSKFFQKNSCLYNLDTALKAGTDNKVYITEGYMDVISCSKYGLKNIVGTMGTAFNENHMKLLNRQKIDTVVLAMDNDNAGINASIQMGLSLLKNKFNVYSLKKNPYPNKDLDEFVNTSSQEQFKAVMDDYYSFIEFIIDCTIVDNLKIDDKLKRLNYVEEIVSKYGDPNLYSYYAKILANKSGFEFEDIKAKIDSKNVFNHNVNRFENEFGIDKERSYSPKKQNKHDAFTIDNIFKIEKTLMFNMILFPEVIKYFVEYLNFFNMEKVDNNYRIIRNILVDTLKLRNINDAFILEQMRKNINNQQFFDSFFHEYLRFKKDKNISKNDSIPEIIKQSIEIIIRLLNYRKNTLIKNNRLTQDEAIDFDSTLNENIKKLTKILENYEI